MRYHAYDEAPDYRRGEVAAQRRDERQKSNHDLLANMAGRAIAKAKGADHTQR